MGKTAKKSQSPAAAAKKTRSNSQTTVIQRQRAYKAVEILGETYPNAKCALTFSTPFQLLVATVLSAQTTDQRVNMVTPELFLRFPDAKSMSAADVIEVSEIIHSIGLYQRKAANLVALSKLLDKKYAGEVPADRDSLTELPGVGRKTANVVLGNCFGHQEITVDTHVGRLSRRLNWATSKNPEIVERELWNILPDVPWTQLCHQLIEHGRKTCHSRKPDCENCPLTPVCPSVQ